MENRKVSYFRCIAIAILIAIASVFGSKNAFALNYSQNIETIRTGDFVFWANANNCRQSGGLGQWSNYSSCWMPAQNGNLSNWIDFTHIEFGQNNANFELQPDEYVQFTLLVKGGSSFPWFASTAVGDGSAPVVDVEINNNGVSSDSGNNWVTSYNGYIKYTFHNNTDHVQRTYLHGGSVIRAFRGSGTGQSQFAEIDYFNITAAGFTVFKKSETVNAQSANEANQSTIEHYKKEDEGRQNINDQDKSGDDYGTGNKQESLLNAIKRFGEALTYKKGDCSAKIPAWGNISGAMTVDLCNTGVVMTGLSVILSVVAVFFFIPLAKSWLDTIIGLIREMQS